MTTARLTKEGIRRLFALLDADLARAHVHGEIYLVGGAVMCLALDARDATRDIDAVYRPAQAVREAAACVAASAGIPETWLNDAVKGFLSPRGEFTTYLELANLRVYVARPEYILAMKCAALRLGAAFHDLDDVRFLLRYLNIEKAADALAIVERYFDASRLGPKTRLALGDCSRGDLRSRSGGLEWEGTPELEWRPADPRVRNGVSCAISTGESADFNRR